MLREVLAATAYEIGDPPRRSAPYLGETFHAAVEKTGIRFNGKLFANLTAAGVAAKGKLGRKGRAASTNGRQFWRFQDPNTGQLVPVSALRPSHRVDVAALEAEIDKL